MTVKYFVAHVVNWALVASSTNMRPHEEGVGQIQVWAKQNRSEIGLVLMTLMHSSSRNPTT